MVVSAMLLSLPELAKPSVKMTMGSMKGLLPESYPDKELLAKQFYSNYDHRYVAVTSLKKWAQALVQVWYMKVVA